MQHQEAPGHSILAAFPVSMIAAALRTPQGHGFRQNQEGHPNIILAAATKGFSNAVLSVAGAQHPEHTSQESTARHRVGDNPFSKD